MANRTTLPSTDIALNLFDDASHSNVPKITGQWFSIKITPDLVADDSFNIGVVFIGNHDHKLRYKLIPSAKPFQCLYGFDGLDNFNFLLQSTRELLDSGVFGESVSPHISYSQPSHSSGITVDEILTSLYNTKVRLQCNDDSIKDEEFNSSYSSDQLRRNFFGKLKKEMPSVYERIYHQDPIKLIDPATNNEIKVSLPIWSEQLNLHNDSPVTFANVISAHYKSEVHRGYSLEKNGCTQVRNACEIKGKKAKAGIFIYRPSVSSIGFSSDIIEQVDNDIEQVLHSILMMKKNGYNIKVEVEDDKNKLYEHMKDFI